MAHCYAPPPPWAFPAIVLRYSILSLKALFWLGLFHRENMAPIALTQK